MLNKGRAEAFCRSYGEAAASGRAEAITGHYGFPYVSFSSGYVSQFDNREQADAQVAAHLLRFEDKGLGHDIRLIDYRVEPVSNGAALCHLRWQIFPQNGLESWVWSNVYGLRQTADGQYFEFNISDNEVSELLTRYPDFFS